MKHCANCHQEIHEEYIGPNTLCPHCGHPLHSCTNCKYYEPEAYHGCHEGVEELVEDKEEENYCDSFSLGDSGPSRRESHDAARSKAEALFKL